MSLSSHFKRCYSSDICEFSEKSTRTSKDIRGTLFLDNAKGWWKVDILINALSSLNSPVSVESVESTGTHSAVVFDPQLNEIRINPRLFMTPFSYRRSLARSLVYAFDNARANIDFRNIDHLTCSTIRGVNISGECDLWTKWVDYIGEDPMGMKMYSMKQRCVRNNVMELVSLQSEKSGSEISSSVDRVWDRCFRDHWPFTTEPHMDTRYRDSPFNRPV
jgi:hypothetical protein